MIHTPADVATPRTSTRLILVVIARWIRSLVSSTAAYVVTDVGSATLLVTPATAKALTVPHRTYGETIVMVLGVFDDSVEKVSNELNRARHVFQKIECISGKWRFHGGILVN